MVGQLIPGGVLVIDPVPAGGGVTVSSKDGAGPPVDRGFVPPPQLANAKINAGITETTETKGRYKGPHLRDADWVSLGCCSFNKGSLLLARLAPRVGCYAHFNVGSRDTNPPKIVVDYRTMPQFVIEREIPGAGFLSEDQIREVSLRSLEALKDMGPQIQWLHSYVTEDKVYCVYLAPDEETVREHARKTGIPANRVAAVRRLIDPKNLAS